MILLLLLLLRRNIKRLVKRRVYLLLGEGKKNKNLEKRFSCFLINVAR